jgi:uncharacterized membrane protein HdeD (DUF308 family)
MPAGLPLHAETIRKYSTWFMIYGIVLAILGALAIIAPGIATLATSIVLGWLLLAGGIFGLIAVFTAGSAAPGFWWNLLTAVLYLLAGILLLWNPIAAALTLTVILAAYLLATGVTKIVLAFGYRPAIPGGWGWMLFSAGMDVLLGILIISGLPGSTLWVLGLLVGINLLFTGIALIMAARQFRSLAAGGTSPRPM